MTLPRMTLSRTTLAGYKLNGGMGGRAEDNARMVWEEVAVLNALAEKYPSYSDTLGKLVEEWRLLVKVGRH